MSQPLPLPFYSFSLWTPGQTPPPLHSRLKTPPPPAPSAPPLQDHVVRRAGEHAVLRHCQVSRPLPLPFYNPPLYSRLKTPPPLAPSAPPLQDHVVRRPGEHAVLRHCQVSRPLPLLFYSFSLWTPHTTPPPPFTPGSRPPPSTPSAPPLQDHVVRRPGEHAVLRHCQVSHPPPLFLSISLWTPVQAHPPSLQAQDYPLPPPFGPTLTSKILFSHPMEKERAFLGSVDILLHRRISARTKIM